MGRYHPLLFLVLTALFAASCGDREEAAHFSWSPERPEAENRLTIRYNPAAPEASLGGSEDLLLRVNLIGEEGGVRAEEIPMEREGGVFAASFTPEDLLDRPVLLVAAVLDADVPEAVDNNRDDPWMIPLYHEGKAAEGAHYRISRLLTGDSRFKEPLRVDPDFDEAR